VASVVVFVHLLATSVWIGGFVAVVIVARVARHELDGPTRIAFFRRLGRSYLVVGGSSLAFALASGSLLLARGDWTATRTVAGALGVALAIATIAGVIQAREMTRIRSRYMHDRQDTEAAEMVRSAAARAALLRASIGTLTIALLAVGSAIAQ
jgi:uncharacterized membrane protein